MKYIEKQIESDTKYVGRIVTVRSDTVELHTGDTALREVVEHSGGVGIVPVDAEGNVYLVRQFRYPMEKEMIEIPAGKLEYGENPLECAKRELSEETGFTAGNYTFLGELYPSPGYCKETLYVYLATDLTAGERHLDADEFLDVICMPLTDFVDDIMANKVGDAKTVIGALKAAKVLAEI